MHFFESLNLLKSTYAACVKPVCMQYGLTRMEFDVLMFLCNHPQFDTASDIVKIRKLTKSHVSGALKGLTQRGLLDPFYREGNRKTIHLRLLPAAQPILEDGRAAQERFGTILFAGFSQEEFAQCRSMFERACAHARVFMQEGSR